MDHWSRVRYVGEEARLAFLRESVSDTSPERVEVDSVGVDEFGGVLIATDADEVRLAFTDVVARH